MSSHYTNKLETSISDIKMRDYTTYVVKNQGVDQTALINTLICTFIVHIPHINRFSHDVDHFTKYRPKVFYCTLVVKFPIMVLFHTINSNYMAAKLDMSLQYHEKTCILLKINPRVQPSGKL